MSAEADYGHCARHPEEAGFALCRRCGDSGDSRIVNMGEVRRYPVSLSIAHVRISVPLVYHAPRRWVFETEPFSASSLKSRLPPRCSPGSISPTSSPTPERCF